VREKQRGVTTRGVAAKLAKSAQAMRRNPIGLQRNAQDCKVRPTHWIPDYTVHACHLTLELKECDPAYEPPVIIILTRHPPEAH
jgi:hypothetical protein